MNEPFNSIIVQKLKYTSYRHPTHANPC